MIPALPLDTNVLYPLRLAEGGWLLVDAGPDYEGAWEDLEALGRAHGVEPGEVRNVLLTHGHIDHAGLAHRWAALGARVLVGSADLEAVRGGEAWSAARREARREELLRQGCPPDVLDAMIARPRRRLRWNGCTEVEAVEDGATFALADGGTLRVLAAPGHTPGNLVAFIEGGPHDGTLFSGDTLLPTTIPTPGLHFPEGSDGPRWPSLPPFLDSVARLRTLPVRRILAGHGEAVDEPERLLARFEAHHAKRAAQVRALLEDRPDTAYGIARRLFPRLPPVRLGQAMVEVIGHIDVLAASGEAAVEGGISKLIERS